MISLPWEPAPLAFHEGLACLFPDWGTQMGRRHFGLRLTPASLSRQQLQKGKRELLQVNFSPYLIRNHRQTQHLSKDTGWEHLPKQFQRQINRGRIKNHFFITFPEGKCFLDSDSCWERAASTAVDLGEEEWSRRHLLEGAGITLHQNLQGLFLSRTAGAQTPSAACPEQSSGG